MFVGRDATVDLLFDPRNTLCQRIPLVQKLPEQESVMVADVTLKSQAQFWNFFFESFLGKRGQVFGVVLPGNDGFDHPSARNAQGVGGNRTEFDVGLFEKLLNAIRHRTLRLLQLCPKARQIAQILNVGGRHKAAPNQAMLQEISDPLTIFGIGLTTRNHFDVMWIHQQQLEMALQHSPDGSPVHPGRFHGNVAYLMLSKPISQPQQIGSHRSETANLSVLAIPGTTDHAGIDALLVHIQSSAASVNHLHRAFLSGYVGGSLSG